MIISIIQYKKKKMKAVTDKTAMMIFLSSFGGSLSIGFGLGIFKTLSVQFILFILGIFKSLAIFWIII